MREYSVTAIKPQENLANKANKVFSKSTLRHCEWDFAARVSTQCTLEENRKGFLAIQVLEHSSVVIEDRTSFHATHVV